ncbi:hypothetical protein pipiens_014062 [Culex pipiens pipiens]|uniref:F-box/LRR-repeat protein 15/At3g58940/PEG3-like LRR domain-containing protein n=1 Tax=Culex pipiens pipiens TaxID=38569 RepID=A0ABD1CVZ6_CULPP
MSQLHPTNVFHLGEKKTVVQLCQIKTFQESIEDFCVTADNAALCEIGRNLRKLKSLRELRISNSGIPIQVLIQFILRCPQLEILNFCFMENITDELVLVFDRLPKLRKFSIYKGALTDISVDFIIEKCPRLVVDISGDQMISKTGNRRLKDFARFR